MVFFILVPGTGINISRDAAADNDDGDLKWRNL
jgi:hypothetical protein